MFERKIMNFVWLKFSSNNFHDLVGSDMTWGFENKFWEIQYLNLHFMS